MPACPFILSPNRRRSRYKDGQKLAQTDALAKLLIEKGLITQEEFKQKISEERATYQPRISPNPI
jgi:protein-disulfide isomerase-like protein with CxxC motif